LKEDKKLMQYTPVACLLLTISWLKEDKN